MGVNDALDLSNRRYSNFTFVNKSSIAKEIVSSMKKLSYDVLRPEEEDEEFFNLNKWVGLHINTYPDKM